MKNVTVHFQLPTWTYKKTKTFIEIINSFTWHGSKVVTHRSRNKYRSRNNNEDKDFT